MRGLRVELSCMMCTFRVPYNTVYVDTYEFPPKTTAIGMLGAAAGWTEGTFLSNLRRIKYGVLMKTPGELNQEVAVYYKPFDREGAQFCLPSPTTRKRKERGKEGGDEEKNKPPKYQRMTRCPVTRYLLKDPKWVLYFASEDTSLIEQLYTALNDPKHVLSVGESENLFYPERPEFAFTMDISAVDSNEVATIVPEKIVGETLRIAGEIRRGTTIIPPKVVQAPIDFNGQGASRRAIYDRLVVFAGFRIALDMEARQYSFNGENAYLF